MKVEWSSRRGVVSKVDSEVQCCLVDSANDFRRRRMCEREGPPFPSISGQPLRPIQAERSRIIDVVDISMSYLCQVNDDTCRLGLMRSQLREVCIAPIGKAYDLPILSFHSRNLEQFQNVQSPVVEKEGVLPEHLAELRDCRMILGKHLCSKLSQGLAYLCFVQLHHCSLIFGIQCRFLLSGWAFLATRNHSKRST